MLERKCAVAGGVEGADDCLLDRLPVVGMYSAHELFFDDLATCPQAENHLRLLGPQNPSPIAGILRDDYAHAGRLRRQSQPLALLASLRLGLAALLDFSREGRIRPRQFVSAAVNLFFEHRWAAESQSLWNDRDQSDNCRPGDDGSRQLQQPGESVGGPPKDDRLHQMRAAAGDDECPE